MMDSKRITVDSQAATAATNVRRSQAEVITSGGCTLAVVSVAILAEIRLYREGLMEALDRRSDIRVVGSAGNDRADVQRVMETFPDVVLIDMAMPGSASIARSVACGGADIKLVALGVRETESHVLACAEVGIAGYVSRDGSLNDLLDTLYGVVRGEARYSPRFVAVLLRRFVARPVPHHAADLCDRLTAREREITELIDQGFTNKEIAKRLCIELATVKNHVHNILEKLRIRRRSEAAALLREQRRTNQSSWSELDPKV